MKIEEQEKKLEEGKAKRKEKPVNEEVKTDEMKPS
jgi:hypothetical protein